MASSTSWATAIGPVTSIFTALLLALLRVLYKTLEISISWLLLGRDCNYNQYTNCVPPSSSRLYTTENEPYLPYHSPAICPAGYTAACSPNGLSSDSLTTPPSLTVQLCCPTGLSCYTGTEYAAECFSVVPPSITIGAVDLSGWDSLAGTYTPRIHQYLNGSQHGRHCCLGSNRNCRPELAQ